MNQDPWSKIEAIFHQALDVAGPDRAAFLDSACAGDSDIRRAVEETLAAFETGNSSFDQAIGEAAAEIIAAIDLRKPGAVFGNYRLERLLGRGGMGEVFLAEDARLGRRVALKFLPAGLSVDSARIERFRQEARTASALNHPISLSSSI